MKHLLFPVLLLWTTLSLSAQPPAYVPMLQDDHVWIYVRYANSDEPVVNDGFALTVGADTVVAGTTYRQLLAHPLAGTQDCPPEERPCFALERPYRVTGPPSVGALMREDTTARQVWRYNEQEDDRYPAEYVVFDFSLSVGDPLPETARNFVCDYFNNPDTCGVVTLIDGDLSLDNRPYLRLHHEGSLTRMGLPALGEVSYTAARGYPTVGILTRPDELVELQDFCRDAPENCLQLLSVRGWATDLPFTLYPNPTDGNVRVLADLPVRRLTYFDNLGRALPSLVEQPAGVYTVRVDFGGGRFGVRRVVKR